MGIISRLSLKMWRTDRTRTLLTILAMTIAATLAVATMVGLRSSQVSLYNFTAQQANGYTVKFPEVNAQNAKKIEQSSLFTKTASYHNVGNVALGDTEQTLDLLEMTPKSMNEVVKPNLIRGRLPQKEGEVVLVDVFSNQIKGSKIKLTKDNKVRDIKIVGWLNSYARSPIDMLAMITYTPEIKGNKSVMGVPASFLGLDNKVKTLARDVGANRNEIYYNDALNYMGVSQSKVAFWSIAGTVIVILLLIGIVSLIVIYTSINLTVKAHRQRYGLLRTIGTTPKQIRKLVYRESVQLAIPSLLFGYLFGIGGLEITMNFINKSLSHAEMSLKINLVADWIPLTIVAVFIILVTLLASARPAIKASSISPIEAVRALDPSAKISKRRMKSTWMMKHTKNPMVLLAQKNYRRNGQRWNMTITLAVTVMLVVGIFGWIENTVTDKYNLKTADISVTATGKPGTAEKISSEIRKSPDVKSVAYAYQAKYKINKGPNEVTRNDQYINLLAVPDDIFAKDFQNTPTIPNRRVESVSADKRWVDWFYPEKLTGQLTIERSESITKTAPGRKTIVTPTFRVVPESQIKNYYLFTKYSYEQSLIISQSQFFEWNKVLADPLHPEVVDSEVGTQLKGIKNHTEITKSIRGAFPDYNVTDYVAVQLQNRTTLMLVRILVFGFIALLSLVSLATIVNHVFANLMEQRRPLAMLQSIGTTSAQLAKMVGVQNSMLFINSGLWGCLLGSVVAYLLFKTQNIVLLTPFIFPFKPILIVVIALFVLWLAFYFFTKRMLRKQNIDQLIRAE